MKPDDTELNRKLQDLYNKRCTALQEYTNVYPPSSDFSLTAEKIYAVPVFPPAPMRVGGIYATIKNTGGGAAVGYAMALYRVQFDHAFSVSANPDPDDGTLRPNNKIVCRKILGPKIYYQTAAAARRFLWLLDREYNLDPRAGVFVIAYQGSHGDAVFCGPTTDTTQYCAFATPGVHTFGEFPEILTCFGGTAPVPSFTLRTRQAVHMIGR